MAQHNKFHAKACEEDGIKFASHAERQRYRDLKLLLAAGHITGLKAHPKFALQSAFIDSDGEREAAITYIADFSYYDNDLGCVVVEDVKSPRTAKLAAFRIKWKWCKRLNPKLKFRVVEA